MVVTSENGARDKRQATRIVSGVLAGVAAAMAVIAIVEAVSGLFFPIPAIDFYDAEAARRAMSAMPMAAQALVVGGWFVGALVGAALAVLIARRAWPGWFPAGSVLVGGIFNALFIPHPLWMNIGVIVAPIAGGALGIALARRTLPRR